VRSEQGEVDLLNFLAPQTAHPIRDLQNDNDIQSGRLVSDRHSTHVPVSVAIENMIVGATKT
jgi:hypothetical protein